MRSHPVLILNKGANDGIRNDPFAPDRLQMLR